jgi:hypothetical protein
MGLLLVRDRDINLNLTENVYPWAVGFVLGRFLVVFPEK